MIDELDEPLVVEEKEPLSSHDARMRQLEIRRRIEDSLEARRLREELGLDRDDPLLEF